MRKKKVDVWNEKREMGQVRFIMWGHWKGGGDIKKRSKRKHWEKNNLRKKKVDVWNKKREMG